MKIDKQTAGGRIINVLGNVTEHNSKSDTPPIHSDPAGEFNWAEVHKDAYDFAMNTLHWVQRDAMHFAKGASWKARPSTPQTGRTYTEGEVDDFINWWHRDYRFCPGEGFMLKSDGRKPFIEVEYKTTKQLLEIFNSKP